MTDGPELFAARRYGIGAGLLISWQGWAVLIACGAVVMGALFLFGDRSPATIAILIIATAILLVITARTTKGGWHWRWGRKA